MSFLALLLACQAGAAPLDPPSSKFQAHIVSTDAAAGYAERVVSFPSPVKSPFKANDTVWAHLRVPDGPGPRPAILVLPVMAAPNLFIERRFIDAFTRRGFVVMWIEMPYQFRRRPHPSQPSGQVFLARTPRGLAANFRQSVLDARRALDFLERQPEVDPERIGLFGVSLGALVGSATYSVDETPRYAVFLLGGADFPSLVATGSMTGPFVRKAEIKEEDMRRAWRGLDPLDYPKKNEKKPVFLINASWDAVIPKANALALKAAFPSSRQKWLPLGHYSSIIHLLWLPRYVAGDFEKNL